MNYISSARARPCAALLRFHLRACTTRSRRIPIRNFVHKHTGCCISCRLHGYNTLVARRANRTLVYNYRQRRVTLNHPSIRESFSRISRNKSAKCADDRDSLRACACVRADRIFLCALFSLSASVYSVRCATFTLSVRSRL